jgi:hypothetical protein
MYSDTYNLSPEERSKKKRQLIMQQMSHQSDLKKVERRKNEIKDDLRRYEQERDRMEMTIKEQKEAMKKQDDRETFLTEELRQIKKRLIELG